MLGPLRRVCTSNESSMPLHDPKTYAAIDKTPMFDAQVDFDQDRSTNDLIIKHSQNIPDDFVSDLKSGKMDSLNTRSGDMMHTMSVPVTVIEDIKRDFGFDMMVEPQRRSMTMLKALGLDAFIVTNKSI
jgi:hypothetical protein